MAFLPRPHHRSRGRAQPAEKEKGHKRQGIRAGTTLPKNFDALGNLLTDRCPKKVRGYSPNAELMMVLTANEMLFAGIDPNQIRFKRAGCFDAGLECGGWGRIVLELRVEELE